MWGVWVMWVGVGGGARVSSCAWAAILSRLLSWPTFLPILLRRPAVLPHTSAVLPCLFHTFSIPFLRCSCGCQGAKGSVSSDKLRLVLVQLLLALLQGLPRCRWSAVHAAPRSYLLPVTCFVSVMSVCEGQ